MNNMLRIEDFIDNVSTQSTSPCYIQIDKTYAVGNVYYHNSSYVKDIKDIVTIINVKPVADFTNKKVFCKINEIGLDHYELDSQSTAYNKFCTENMSNIEILKKYGIKPKNFSSSPTFRNTSGLNSIVTFEITVKSIITNKVYDINVDMYSSSTINCKFSENILFYSLSNCEYVKKYKKDNDIDNSYTEVSPEPTTIKKMDVICKDSIEYLLNDFQLAWAIIRKNNTKEYTGEHVEIDGTVYANGFLMNVPYHKEFLGAMYIPQGYRLATCAELDKLMSSKFLQKIDDNKNVFTYRNKFGFEYSIDRSISLRNGIMFYTYEDTNIYEKDTYFPVFSRCYCKNNKSTTILPYAANICYDSRYPENWGAFYVIVKMTDKEIEKEKQTIESILNKNIHRRKTVDSILKKFGLTNIDNIQSIKIEATNKSSDGSSGDSKTIVKHAYSNEMLNVQKYLSSIFGEENVENSTNIDIRISGKNGFEMSHTIDKESEIDIKKYIKYILPLLCRQAIIGDNIEPRYSYYPNEDYYKNLYKSFIGSYNYSDIIAVVIAARNAIKMIGRPTIVNYKCGFERISSLTLNIKSDIANDNRDIVINFGDISLEDLMLSGMYDEFKNTELYNKILDKFAKLKIKRY